MKSLTESITATPTIACGNLYKHKYVFMCYDPDAESVTVIGVDNSDDPSIDTEWNAEQIAEACRLKVGETLYNKNDRNFVIGSAITRIE